MEHVGTRLSAYLLSSGLLSTVKDSDVHQISIKFSSRYLELGINPIWYFTPAFGNNGKGIKRVIVLWVWQGIHNKLLNLSIERTSNATRKLARNICQDYHRCLFNSRGICSNYSIST